MTEQAGHVEFWVIKEDRGAREWARMMATFPCPSVKWFGGGWEARVGVVREEAQGGGPTRAAKRDGGGVGRGVALGPLAIKEGLEGELPVGILRRGHVKHPVVEDARIVI